MQSSRMVGLLAIAICAALGRRAFAFHDVEVVRADSGAPSLRVTGRAEALALEKGAASWQVSLSHTDSVAVAVVILA